MLWRRLRYRINRAFERGSSALYLGLAGFASAVVGAGAYFVAREA